MNRAADAASEIIDEFGFLDDWEDPVSYTHLTLPTNREV